MKHLFVLTLVLSQLVGSNSHAGLQAESLDSGTGGISSPTPLEMQKEYFLYCPGVKPSDQAAISLLSKFYDFANRKNTGPINLATAVASVAFGNGDSAVEYVDNFNANQNLDETIETLSSERRMPSTTEQRRNEISQYLKAIRFAQSARWSTDQKAAYLNEFISTPYLRYHECDSRIRELQSQIETIRLFNSK